MGKTLFFAVLGLLTVSFAMATDITTLISSQLSVDNSTGDVLVGHIGRKTAELDQILSNANSSTFGMFPKKIEKGLHAQPSFNVPKLQSPIFQPYYYPIYQSFYSPMIPFHYPIPYSAYPPAKKQWTPVVPTLSPAMAPMFKHHYDMLDAHTKFHQSVFPNITSGYGHMFQKPTVPDTPFVVPELPIHQTVPTGPILTPSDPSKPLSTAEPVTPMAIKAPSAEVSVSGLFGEPLIDGIEPLKSSSLQIASEVPAQSVIPTDTPNVPVVGLLTPPREVKPDEKVVEFALQNIDVPSSIDKPEKLVGQIKPDIVDLSGPISEVSLVQTKPEEVLSVLQELDKPQVPQNSDNAAVFKPVFSHKPAIKDVDGQAIADSKAEVESVV